MADTEEEDAAAALEVVLQCVTNAEAVTTLCVTVPRLTLISLTSVSTVGKKDISPKIADSPKSGEYVNLVSSAARKPT